MGSKIWLETAEDYYIFGLWLADGYWRSSSIGLSSINQLLIKRFHDFLSRKLPNYPIKYRCYMPIVGQKRKHKAYHVYINCREMTRFFMSYKTKKQLAIPNNYIPAYLAGRIDGDGSIDNKHRSGIRIAYSNYEDAKRDAVLFGRDNISIYHYLAAGTWVIYLRKNYRDKIVPKASKYSVKLLPRRD